MSYIVCVIESNVTIIPLEGCKGDSGAPLWIEDKKMIAAVYFGRTGLACGTGWNLATKLTHPKILSWIRDMLDNN